MLVSTRATQGKVAVAAWMALTTGMADLTWTLRRESSLSTELA